MEIETIKMLLKTGISNYKVISGMPQNYGTFNLSMTGLVLGRILE